MKKFLLAAASKVQIGLYLTVLSTAAAAQGVGSVVESQPFTPGQSSTQTAAPASTSNNDALSLLLNQNQQLQAEVQALRGLVEEQGFELRKLQRDSLSRYTDMDDRLSGLESGAASSAINSVTAIADPASSATTSTRPISTRPALGTPTTGIPPISTAPSTGARGNPSANPLVNTSRPAGRGTLQPAVLSEQQLYQMAYDSVINSNFDRSIAEFDQYLSIYPEGRFVTNAFYWKGQAFLYLNRYTEARESYEIILEQYPDSPKLPDAMYGLGLAYEGLGNISQARQLLNDIKRRFPNTGVANLADTRLLSLD